MAFRLDLLGEVLISELRHWPGASIARPVYLREAKADLEAIRA